MKVISAFNVPEAYAQALSKMRVWAQPEDSRNGLVQVARHVMLELVNPEQRVIFDPIRNANPFFHVAEFVWMMSGIQDIRWIEQFNSKIREYADPGTHIHHGAYGNRWRNHFGLDQLIEVRNLLGTDPNTRRAVLTMWDPSYDLEHHNDLPCNTHIYFAVVKGALDMTVCNRSNDLIWGMLGANVVHMTLLMELLARDLRIPVGFYRVFTNNLHVYESLPNFDAIWNTQTSYDPYGGLKTYPILSGDERLEEFLMNCKDLVRGYGVTTSWLRRVAVPMIDCYRARKEKRDGRGFARNIQAEDWHHAAMDYIERKELAKDTLKG